MSRNEIVKIGTTVYNFAIMEADRIEKLRNEALDLYTKNPFTGEFELYAEAYGSGVESVAGKFLKNKKARFFFTFTETLKVEDSLKPIALRLIRFLVRKMGYGNTVYGFGIRDISEEMGVHSRYVTSGIQQLVEKNMLKFTVHKGRRTYMVNPTYYYKGNIINLIKQTKKFDEMGKVDGKEEEYAYND